jgi:hypothetical protein
MITITTLVIDVRTTRIVFFTAAEPCIIPADSRNLVATMSTAELPEQMTLTNCYLYRYEGGKIIRPPINAAPKPLDTVERNNRKALNQALRAKLQALWTAVPDWHPSEDRVKRANAFYGLDQALTERIAASTTEPEFSGLALEIEQLSI